MPDGHCPPRHHPVTHPTLCRGQGSTRMSETRQPTPFGRSNPPNEAWLAQQPSEPILDPDLPIIDTHHHLWQRPQHRYLLDELLADLRSGHNVVATVFAECHSMYRADGPEAFRPVGEDRKSTRLNSSHLGI